MKWTVEPSNHPDLYDVIDRNSIHSQVVRHATYERATLIASAPHLLAERDALLRLVEEVVNGINDEWCRWFSAPQLLDDEREWLERAEEFIAQARVALDAAEEVGDG